MPQKGGGKRGWVTFFLFWSPFSSLFRHILDILGHFFAYPLLRSPLLQQGELNINIKECFLERPDTLRMGIGVRAKGRRPRDFLETFWGPMAGGRGRHFRDCLSISGPESLRDPCKGWAGSQPKSGTSVSKTCRLSMQTITAKDKMDQSRHS